MPRILIADDNPQNAELLEAHLEGTGFDTRIAVNGSETVELAKSWKPDVILLDVMMPKLSGFEVCKQLRADPTSQGIGILMVTALDQVTDIDRALEAGTDDFLTRPVNKTELVLRVKSLLDSVKETSPTERTLAYLGRVQQGV
jgi:two-component system, OmpR family, alkaline phosphatase synthesis response regulator PhoP